MKKHINITVTGRVQGVGFRYSAQEEAEELGIKGFVRNMPDGSVYIEAEGEEEDLLRFIDWCRQGPGYAHVKDLLIQEAPLGHFSDFEIRR
ncbi:MAG TPA: acylphosphatase [Bacteroidales bacterium]|nr:acylphosphatase [Bacteroidales bacterium]HQK38448.1 acylphosphatase [Bacteroidales bacterium]